MNRGKLITAGTSIILLAFSLPAVSQLQGSLFTSPEQRVYLDYLRESFLALNREKGFDIDASIPDIPTGEGEAQADELYTLGGIITRRDGSHSIWLNRQVYTESELPAGMRLTSENGVLGLRIRANGETFYLKPGQTLNLTTRSSVENYQRQPTPGGSQLLGADSTRGEPDSGAARGSGTAERATAAQSAEAQEKTEPSAEEAATQTAADPSQPLAESILTLGEEALGNLIETLQILQQQKVDEAEADDATE